MQYFTNFNGRVVKVTYELGNNGITISCVKILAAGNWEEQTGEALNGIRSWMISECEDEMMSSW